MAQGRSKIQLYLGLLPFIAVLLLWFGIAGFQLAPQWLLPTPAETAQTFWALLLDGTIPSLLAASALNAIPAFLASFACAVLSGLLIGSSDILRKIFLPFMSALYPIPSLAWLPLIILFVGFSRWAIWIVIFIAVFIRVIYVMVDGVRTMNRHYILVARNVGYSYWQTLFFVVLPGSMPAVMTGARLGFGSAWRSLIGAEMLVITLGGLGKFIWYAQWYYSFDKVFVGIFMISIIGIVIEQLVLRTIEKKTLERWGVHDTFTFTQ